MPQRPFPLATSRHPTRPGIGIPMDVRGGSAPSRWSSIRLKPGIAAVSVLLLLLICAFASSGLAQQTDTVLVASPNRKLAAMITTDAEQHLTWALHLHGRPVVLPSRLGIDFGGVDYGKNVALGSPVFSQHDASFAWQGVHRTAMNHYVQARITVKPRGGPFTYILECRVFDDGFAYRFLLPRGGTVTGESSSWHIPDGSTVWCQENVNYYEGLHYANAISDLGGKQMGPPVTFRTRDGIYGCVSEAALYNYSGMSLHADSAGVLHSAFVNDPSGWYVKEPVVSPWRVVLVSDDLNGLVNSDIIAALNPASAETPGALSWIRPGRAVWSYFVHDNVTTLDLEKSYVDKAAALGFEYSIVDAGWDSSWPNALDSLRSLVHYAGQRHVGIFVWKSYASLKDDSIRRAFFRSMHSVGLAGLKIDYIDTEGIAQVRFYEKALRDGLRNHLLIDFHGANKPSGYNRRYPNEITREGIYGQEWRTYTPQGAINNAILPFTRFLVGPADYTPGVFSSQLAYGTSRAQQLALPVIYNSPLLCWADDPAFYLASPAASVIRSIPTIWDETRVLEPSRIGELVVFARRKGADWFVAVINSGEERRLMLPLHFLGAGAFRAEIIADDLTSHDSILRSVRRVDASDSLPVILQTKGGFVARLSRGAEMPPSIAIRPAGAYLLGPQPVRIDASSGADLRYTLDGSLPNETSPLYTGSLVIDRPSMLRVRGMWKGRKDTRSEAADVVAQFLAAPAPLAMPSGGIFVGQEAVRLTSQFGGKIRYTTDGSEPNAQSALYRDSLLLDGTTTLKCRAFFAAGGSSLVNRLSFRQVEPDPAQSITTTEHAQATTKNDSAQSTTTTDRSQGTTLTIGAHSTTSTDRSQGTRPTHGVQSTADTNRGLGYDYYEGRWDSMPRFDRMSSLRHGTVLFPRLDSLPTRANEYGLRFHGLINIPETGVYTFYTISDDGSKLYIGDQLVVDNDGDHGDLEKSGDRALAAGLHSFTLDYFQNGSGQTLQVFMKGPHRDKQPIPPALFSIDRQAR